MKKLLLAIVLLISVASFGQTIKQKKTFIVNNEKKVFNKIIKTAEILQSEIDKNKIECDSIFKIINKNEDSYNKLTIDSEKLKLLDSLEILNNKIIFINSDTKDLLKRVDQLLNTWYKYKKYSIDAKYIFLKTYLDTTKNYNPTL